jgi:hypothetical protein
MAANCALGSVVLDLPSWGTVQEWRAVDEEASTERAEAASAKCKWVAIDHRNSMHRGSDRSCENSRASCKGTHPPTVLFCTPQ